MAHCSVLIGAEILQLQAEGRLKKLKCGLKISIRERGVDIHRGLAAGYPQPRWRSPLTSREGDGASGVSGTRSGDAAKGWSPRTTRGVTKAWTCTGPIYRRRRWL